MVCLKNCAIDEFDWVQHQSTGLQHHWKKAVQILNRVCTCSEEEHSHSPIVPSVRTMAERDECHQKCHQSRSCSSPEQHQSGNLPVYGTGTQVRGGAKAAMPQQKTDSSLQLK
ncbi:hypothetical protein NL108_014693 [Boleophthalmus pectinirostris]|nr:hypothetical protein NL108_014693 [Boleophthalmus pectinirostris]